MNFPVGFNIVDFILACGAGAPYLVSGFLTKGIVVCIVVNLVSKYERESLVLPSIYHLADSPASLSYIKHLL